MALSSDATRLPSTSFCAFIDMMKPALSAKNTDTTPTVTAKDDDDDTSSSQLLMQVNVMENKTFSDFKMPADATTDDDTGATASMDEEEDISMVVWNKIKPPSSDPPASPPPPCTSPLPPLDE